jgi:hypothetical protein
VHGQGVLFNFDPGAAAAEDHAAPSAEKTQYVEGAENPPQERFKTPKTQLSTERFGTESLSRLPACVYNLASPPEKSSVRIEKFSGVLNASQT